jgi:hypothetical protein
MIHTSPEIDSVSYSFSNNIVQSNMLCEHSFSKDMQNYGQFNNYEQSYDQNIKNQHQNHQNFQKYHIQPPIY